MAQRPNRWRIFGCVLGVVAFLMTAGPQGVLWGGVNAIIWWGLFEFAGRLVDRRRSETKSPPVDKEAHPEEPRAEVRAGDESVQHAFTSAEEAITYHQYGLKTLLAAMLTCAVAFAVISWKPNGPHVFIPQLLLTFWIVSAIMYVGGFIPGTGMAVGFVRVVFCGGLIVVATLALSAILAMVQ